MHRRTTNSTHLHIRSQALSSSLRDLRALATDWAAQRGLSEEAIYGLAVATDEAMSNVVRHAYGDHGGVLDLQATSADCGKAIIVIVSDEGSWRTPVESATGGHGFALIRGFADHSEVVASRHGTVVRMKWQVQPPYGSVTGSSERCDICAGGIWTGSGFRGQTVGGE
jgi:anti-sigma regulatory factor (Ser/Thr protein kinase)